jgi:membrane associated rhomboid family serine protease
MTSSRSSEVLQNIPPATFAIISLCCAVYGCQLVMDPDVHHFTMNPRSVIHLHEYYRFITSTVFHGSLMHIGMNMMSTFAICGLLEARFGTLRHAMTILWAMLLTSATYTLVAFLLHALFGYEPLMYQHALGFSGVIFHLSVLECNLSNGSRSIFGVFSVPSYLYPWALLLVLQFVMPNLSFMGHLAGILTGTLQSYGALDGIMVGEQYAKEMEGWAFLRPVTSRPNYVSAPTTSAADTTLLPRDGLVQAACKGVQMVVKFGRDLLETLVYIVFGRGREANSNIQISGRATTVVENGSDDFEDDDWVGLPVMPEAPNSEQSRLL